MKTRRTLIITTGAASAIALLPAAQAQAHDVTSGLARPAVAPHASYRALLADLATVPLERLDAWSTTLQTAAAAVPDDAVLTGRTRLLAKQQLRAAAVTVTRLSTLDGLTAAQQAKVDVITSRLTAAAASLRALLANRASPTVAPVAAVVRSVPVTVVQTSVTRTVRATDTRHACDSDRTADRTGDRSGDRTGDRSAVRDTRISGDRDRDRNGDRTGDRDGVRRAGRHHR